MKRCIVLLLPAILLLLSSCGFRTSNRYSSEEISKTIGVDVSYIETATIIDSHGGMGDGCACITMTFDDDSCEEDISRSNLWHELPLSDNLMKIVYGTVEEGHYISPYITFNDDKTPSISYVEEGYYFFLDRHSQSKTPHDDQDIFDRNSYNLTVAIYDSQSDTMYYLELDT